MARLTAVASHAAFTSRDQPCASIVRTAAIVRQQQQAAAPPGRYTGLALDRAAADDLVARRYLLPEDGRAYVEAADRSNIGSR